MSGYKSVNYFKGVEHLKAVIRKAQKKDIQAIQHVAKESWHDTYKELIPEAIQDQFLEQAYSDEMMAKRIDHSLFLVAENDSDVIGYAAAFQKENEADLSAIYLLPDAKGNGVGTQLLEGVLEALDSVKELYVEVEKGNTSGETFYEAKGFAVVDEYEDDLFGHVLQTKKMVLVI
ncbi:GNAT family N-acetyltransferase [Planomicrobium chinense]|uniref:GNAT family N-acetyltransferase n=1 Tax=Planococcus chinensis TaxID=272917 RepID=UPI001CC33765|nr:GNAT family N-acetyltransferase [Planococcus chinensis]MBZ5201866.1 GNAT family N-acetyltransferase [Planococcus chinensis]